MADRLPLNVGFTEYWESTTTDFLWPISTVQANEQERPTPAVGTFVAQWLMYFVSGRPRISSGNAEFGVRYDEGLFVICHLELKREFDQLDLTEGERNECVWNSPSRKAYGRSERAVHGLRTE